MPSINRTTIISGPAIITFAGSSFWSKGDVTVTVKNNLFDIQTAHFGKVDQRFSDRRIEVAFEPSGAYTTTLAAVLWPYAATALGSSIYGAADRELVVWGRDGKKLSVPNASVTEMPSIRLGVNQTMIGSMKLTGLVKNSTDPTTAGAYYALTTATYPGDTGFTIAEILTKSYASAWGITAPWSAFGTEAGWEIGFNLGLAEQTVDGIGTCDMKLKSMDVTAKCVPVGPDATDILTKLAGTGGMGASISSADHLNISATGVYFRLYKASMTDSSMVYGSEKKRLGATTWVATRSVTAGTADPLFFIGAIAPA